MRILGKLVYRRLILLERPLGDPLPEVPSQARLAVGQLEETEVDEYLEFRPDTVPAEVRRRLAAGQRCFLTRHEGRIVSATWAAVGRVRVDYLAYELPLEADEVYCYDSLTAPSARGRDITAARSIERMRYLRDAGYRRMLGLVLPENAAARRHAAKLGWRPIGVIGCVRLGPWRWYFRRVTPSGSGRDDGARRSIPSCVRSALGFLAPRLARRALPRA